MKSLHLRNNFAAAIIASLGFIGMGSMSAAQAQLQLSNSPIRVQIGNGAALLGSNDASSNIGISVLSSKVGAANDAGTSIRLLGDTKTLGAYTTLLKTNEPNGTNVQLKTPLEGVTAPLIQ